MKGFLERPKTLRIGLDTKKMQQTTTEDERYCKMIPTMKNT
jgi:hypothetical protein